MEESQKLRTPVIIATLVFGAIFLWGLKWVFTTTPSTEGAFFYLFDYAVGLTMIFLPCTLPLAFVVVPLAMGKGYARGLGIALSFGLGVAITLSFYGALLGWVGQRFIGQAETAKNVMYMVAGALGFLFALGDIGLTKFRMPTYSGAFPGFIQRQQEFLKAGLLGLFLGNIGVGCPNPLFNAVIVPQILVSGSLFQGWLIMFIQALGRITPLFLLAFLAILGVNATGFLVKHRTKVEHATGWAMIFVAGFLFSLGAFTHDWYVYSGIHTYLESLTQEELVTTILGKQIGTLGHAHAVPTITPALKWGSIVMVTMWLIPFVWVWRRKKQEAKAATDPLEQGKLVSSAKLFGSFTVALAAFFYLTFGYVLPHNFLNHGTHAPMSPAFSATFRLDPPAPEPGQEALLYVSLKNEKGEPLQNLTIEHERLVHVILVSEDLSQFSHSHVEDYTEITDEMKQSATFPIEVVFPKSGNYAVAVNFLHEGHAGIVKGMVRTGGTAEEVTLKKDGAREKIYGDTKISLTTNPGEIRSGEEAHLEYRFSDAAGKPITDLEQYLAAPMHIAVWSFDLGYFLHTHGEVPGYGHEVPQGTKFGPLVDSHITFPYPGLYKVIGEFSRGGKVTASSFVVDVKQGTSATNAMPAGGHSH